MTDTRHPITPPAELVWEWWEASPVQVLATDPDPIQLIAARAAQWGADQELEACLDWLDRRGSIVIQDELRAARRPKPPSLKQQALCALIDGIERGGHDQSDLDTIRLALEQLDD